MVEKSRSSDKPAVKPTGQADDNIDDMGRDINQPDKTPGDRATVDRTSRPDKDGSAED